MNSNNSSLTTILPEESTGVAPENVQAIMIAFEVINIILLLMTAWVLLCMICYGVKTKRWSRSGGSSRLDRGTIYLVCSVALAAAFPRLLMTEVVIRAVNFPDGYQYCEVVLDVGNIAYYFASFSIYFFLWLRQRTIYAHPSSKSFAGKWTNVVSYICLIALSGISIIVTYFYVAPESFVGRPYGCISDPSVEGIPIVDFLSAGALILCQVSLLALFIYPLAKSGVLVKQHSTRSERTTSSVTSPTRFSRRSNFTSSVRDVFRGSRSANRIAKLIRRSLMSASIAVAADLATMIVTVAIPRIYPQALLMVAYNTSNFVKAICILSTFSFYQKILLVFCGSVGLDSKMRASTSSNDGTGNGRPKPELSSASAPDIFVN